MFINVKEKPVNNPPISNIFSPNSGDEFRSDDIIQFSAQGSTDPDGDSVVFIWFSNLDGELLRTSNIMEVSSLSQGIHVITLRVEDSMGEYDEQSIQITVSLTEESFESDESTLISPSFLFSSMVIVAISLASRKR